MELLEAFQYPSTIRALLAGSMVGVMCGVLGCFIVLRNMALIGDALAHAILPGVVVAMMIVGYSAAGLFVGAVAAGLFTAIGITWIQHRVSTKNDAAIGIVFTAMFSLGVIGISYLSNQGGVHLDLDDFLFGKILGISDEDLILTASILVYVLISVAVFYRYLFITTFQSVIAETMDISVKMVHYFLMLLLSFAIVGALRTVGVILVVAMLITPASTALLLSNRLHKVIWIAGVIGLLSAVLGMLVSIKFDTPPGPAMAIMATLIYLIAVFFAPENGLLFTYLRKQKLQRRIQLEDTLKRSFRLQQEGKLSIANLLTKLDFSELKLKFYLRKLRKQQLIQWTGNEIKITDKGREEARRLVRAHRLWETYLVDRVGLNEGQIHEDAERLEHLLSEEVLDQVDRSLGFPSKDPHGSPIPSKKGTPEFSLIKLDIASDGTIAKHQLNEHISTRLWELGLLPGMDFIIESKSTQGISLRLPDKLVLVPYELAGVVGVAKK